MNEQLTQQILNSIKADMILTKDLLKETSHDMVAEGYSHFPIFVAHQLDMPVGIGENLIDHKELGLGWSINASTLEEFLDKGIIKKDREAFFRETFKNPQEFACFFFIYKEDGNFAFIPFITETEKPGHS